MNRLVALDLPGGTRFVEALRRVWDAGDAALPVDQRLPESAKRDLLVAMAVGAVITADAETVVDGGLPVETGDALVMTTSGSTGQPKGAVLTHDAIAASASATSTRLGATADDHWLACLPLAHVGGLAVVTRALHTGAALTVHARFDPAEFAAAVREGVTLTALVPTALARVDPRSLRQIILGGSRPPQHRPPNVVTTYGMTETGSGVVYDGQPLPGVEVRIADDGEVLVRGPMLLRCYRDGSTPVDAEGWLHTDDVGRWRDDGRLDVAGRRGDLIITGGENVWPEAVEAILGRHDRIADVAVAGVADAEWGQIVTAWIVTPDGADAPSLDELRGWMRDHAPAYMAPRRIEVVPTLPRTALGKIRRQSLLDPGPASR